MCPWMPSTPAVPTRPLALALCLLLTGGAAVAQPVAGKSSVILGPAPGVYVVELPSTARPIDGVGTATGFRALSHKVQPTLNVQGWRPPTIATQGCMPARDPRTACRPGR